LELQLEWTKIKYTKYNTGKFAVGGVDEAGRGSLFGPIIVAGICMNTSQQKELRKIGIRDSKLLTPNQRRSLITRLVECSESLCVCKLSPSVVDQAVIHTNLNLLEAEAMAVVIENILPSTVIVDSCDVNPIRYRDSIMRFLPFQWRKNIISVHHAEKVSVAVAGASILAKVIRDYEISKIGKEYGEIGSGYPSDKKTIRFLQNWINNYSVAPTFVRKSWKTMKRFI